MPFSKVFICLFSLVVSGFFATAATAAGDIRVIGDSIGEGVHLATNYPSPANRFNVAIYTPNIFEQIKAMPEGATVFMSLGTNDAVGGLVDQSRRVDQIVAAAAAQKIKLYWLGPPCVLKPWEVSSRKLDEHLAAQLSGASVTYVSLQDPEFCEASLHAGDGVHFTMAGYSRIWQKAATVAGVPVAVASASVHTVKMASAHPRHCHGRKHAKACRGKAPIPPAT